MNLSLRAKLRLSEGCSKEELQDTCNRYYTIYKGVLESSTDEAVRRLAEKKLADLVKCAQAEAITLVRMAECSDEPHHANICASVEAELASYSGRLSKERATQLNNKINALPRCAKRYYLSALVDLNVQNTTLKGFEGAVAKLVSAVKEDPDNPVYQAMIDSAEMEIRRYRQRVDDELERKNKEERDTLRKQRWRAFFSTLGTILSGIGSVLLWIGGALVTVIGAIFSCVCSGCDAC